MAKPSPKSSRPPASPPNPGAPAANPAARGGTRRDWVTLAFLAAAVLIVFWPVLDCGFVNYDDPDYVTANRHIQGLTWANLGWALRSLFIYWQPLTWLTYMVDYQLAGLSARQFHATNLLFHLLATGALFAALRRLSGEWWGSALVAALFALHPLHVEPVAWISERKGLVSAGFAFLTLWAYARYAERPAAGRYALVAGLFLLGLTAKAMLVTLPCVLLLLDYWPLRRFGWPAPTTPGQGRPGGPAGDRQRSVGFLALEKVPLLVLSAGSCVMALLAQAQAQAIIGLDRLPLTARLAHALVSYFTYLRKTLWPVDLAVFYPRASEYSVGLVLLAASVLLGLTVWAVGSARRQPFWLVGWLWFLGTLTPVIGLVQAGDQGLADRYTYIPLVGLFWAAVWGLLAATRRWPGRRLLLDGTAVALVVACAAFTGRQLRCWQSTATLFEHALAVTTNNQVALTAVGSLRAGAGRFAAATNLFGLALRAEPKHSDAHLHWGVALEKQGELDAAIAHYEQAVRLRPTFAEAHDALGTALIKKGRFSEAAAHYEAGLKSQPDSAGLLNNLALARQREGRLDEAITWYTAALRVADLAVTRNNLAIALHARGRIQEAVAQYQAALGLGMEPHAVGLNLGAAFTALGRDREALAEYRRVVQAQPESPPALGKLAWLLATSADATVRNGAEALRLGERLCQLTERKDPLALSTLAAAQAELGRYPEAVETNQKAISLAKAANQEPLAQVLEGIAELYRANKPYRATSK